MNETSAQVSHEGRELLGELESPSWNGKPGCTQEAYLCKDSGKSSSRSQKKGIYISMDPVNMFVIYVFILNTYSS